MKDENIQRLDGRHFLRFIAFFVSVFVMSCLMTVTVIAQENEKSADPGGVPGGGIQISPTKFVWTLQEGDTKTGWAIVKNYSDQTQIVQMEVEDFFVKDDGSTPQLFVPNDEHPLKAFDVINWITPPETLTLEAGEAKRVEFAVRVPDGQPTSGYYGSLLFKTGGEDDSDAGSHIGLSYRIGALIIMAIQGDEPMVTGGEIQKFYPEKKIFWNTPAALYADINNTGNIHYPIFSEIEVKKNGKKFHVIKMNPRILYPQKMITWREVMDFKVWDIGKYSAHITMHSEDETVQMEADTSFWIIPWRLLVLITVGLFVFIVLWKLFRRYIHIGIQPQKSKKKK